MSIKYPAIAFVLMLLLPGLSMQASAQNLPGQAISENTVSQSAITLIDLASQAFPDLFAQASGWRLFEGFQYRYFASSGVFVGFQNNSVYLLGGPFGNEVTYQGRIADVTAFVQQELGHQGAAFQNLVAASTLRDLINYFRKLTLDYSSGITGVLSSNARVAMEVVGKDTVSGNSTDRLKVTVSGSNVTTPLVYDMWVNDAGTVVRLIAGGFEYPQQQAAVLGSTVLSGMLLAMQPGNTPAVRAAINNELANNAAVSQKTFTRNIGSTSVKAFEITISAGSTASATYELGDFGKFTMLTRMNSRMSTTTATFEFIEAVPH